jgi:DNA-3-methyladenine glycosylase
MRTPLLCAREMIGCRLDWRDCAGIIVETEAYSVRNDEACHTFHRPSARSFVARHPAGAAYIYLNYGVHWLLNVLVKGGAEDGFVLIRALEPIEGIAAMERRRGTPVRKALCSGPGKLSQALGVRGVDHGSDLCGTSPGWLSLPAEAVTVTQDVRIGISRAAHLPWRFLLEGSLFVSVRSGSGEK